MVMLYITAPIAVILNTMPHMTLAQVSWGRVKDLLAELPREQVAPTALPEPWTSIQMRQVCYQHHGHDDNHGFRVGPFDLEFLKGEITFIVGGNGSGKSTLCKLLTLHYRASAGEIYFGNQLISSDTIGAFRQDIASIYSDYHLFDRIFGLEIDQGEVDHYLKLLQLEHKVKYTNGRFSTLSLSDGQRRRMALVVALLEDKELYLFDEWAADQDPTFKQAFYLEPVMN